MVNDCVLIDYLSEDGYLTNLLIRPKNDYILAYNSLDEINIQKYHINLGLNVFPKMNKLNIIPNSDVPRNLIMKDNMLSYSVSYSGIPVTSPCGNVYYNLCLPTGWEIKKWEIFYPSHENEILKITDEKLYWMELTKNQILQFNLRSENSFINFEIMIKALKGNSSIHKNIIKQRTYGFTVLNDEIQRNKLLDFLVIYDSTPSVSELHYLLKEPLSKERDLFSNIKEKEIKDKFKFELGQIFFDNIDLQISTGLDQIVFKRLIEKFGQVVIHEDLFGIKLTKANDQLRGAITGINARLREKKVPVVITSIRATGYVAKAKIHPSLSVTQ